MNIPRWLWIAAILAVVAYFYIQQTQMQAPKSYPIGWWWPGKKR